MKDLKMVLGVVGVCVVLVGLMIFGLSKMSGEGAVVDENKLADGALMATRSGEVKVRVVNFSDMECPACKAAHGVIGGLRKTEGVEFVFRHYPLRIHKHAVISAKAVEAARQMGKGWEMMDLLFEKQEEWTGVSDIEKKLEGYAVSLGLDSKDFMVRIASSQTDQAVAADRQLAESMSLGGTPTIFVNGVMVSPQFVMEKVREALTIK